jgi:hypothetical protein
MNLQTDLGALELGALALIDDGALEAIGGGSNPFSLPPMCPRIDALGIDDGTLEATAGLFAGAPTKPSWTGACCGRVDAQGVDDGALESAAGLQMGPQTMRRLANTLCVA